jgi:hypothetical protein
MRTPLFLSVFLLTLSCAPGVAQVADPRTQDHEALHALLVSATEAVNRGDAEALGRLLAPDFVATFSDQTRITDRAGLAAYLDRILHAEDAPLAAIHLQPVADAPTAFIGEDAGVAYGSSKDSFMLADGIELTLDSRWTATLVRDDGQWKIRAFHAGVNMLDNPILLAAGRLSWAWGAGGLVLGLLLGWQIARRRDRADG